ncbi:MAG: hypothetical protein ACJ782_00010 [Actinomycetota bacterium]|jgi:hypothetical protein
MSDSFPEQNALEERSLELRETEDHDLPLEADPADAVDQQRPVAAPPRGVSSSIADGVSEADALDQARLVYDDDEDDPRGG